MDNTIQFIGLALFMITSTGLQVQLPSMSDFHPPHEAFIAFPANAEVATEGWSIVDKPFTAHDGRAWKYIGLTGEHIRINNGLPPKPGVPEELPHLQADCCPPMKLKQNPKLSARVDIPAGMSRCGEDIDRIDTVISVKSAVPLEIVTVEGPHKRLTFKGPAQIVIGNIPIGYITGQIKPDTNGHFVEYYHRLGDPNAQTCTKTPKDNACAPRVACTQHNLLITLPPTKGAAIDCSNSQFP